MRENTKIPEIKRMNKVRIANYIFKQGHASKVDIAYSLGLSMPTVLQNIKELVETGVVEEIGEYQSTGGRKAKTFSIVADSCYAVGVDITAHHVGLVLVDAKGMILLDRRTKKHYEDSLPYYQELCEITERFIEQNVRDTGKIIGVGVSIPGIIDRQQEILIQSHALKVSNVSLKKMHQFLPYRLKFDNDANCAAYTELSSENRNVIYLSLNNTVGGAIIYNGKLLEGDNFKSGEFGHMIIVPDGKRCYCGKTGCVDCYCSALVLSSHTDGNLERFFDRLKNGDPVLRQVWDQYLQYLALTVSNLRMVFDCDIILGGYVGGYVQDYLIELNQLVMELNKFDYDASYIRCGKYQMAASAYGIAMRFIQQFYETLK
ncbi:MAG: ROK family transcriptional regulator [Clostridiales bacterium]|nr:ROK family transcriptional regulator [Clostridiales bacterium]